MQGEGNLGGETAFDMKLEQQIAMFILVICKLALLYIHVGQ